MWLRHNSLYVKILAQDQDHTMKINSPNGFLDINFEQVFSLIPDLLKVYRYLGHMHCGSRDALPTTRIITIKSPKVKGFE